MTAGRRPSRWRGAALASALTLAVLLAAGLLLTQTIGGSAIARGQALLRVIQAMGPLGWLAFVVAQTVVAAIGFLPASLLGVAAGVLYGAGLGFLLAAIATMAGAILSFWLSRSALRPLVVRALARRARLAALDRALARDGWRLVCLLRVNPVMPFAPTSFVLGLSGIGWRAYLLGTLAALPALLAFVALGAFADAGLAAWQAGAGGLHWALLLAGVAATALLSLRIGWLATRAGLASDPTLRP